MGMGGVHAELLNDVVTAVPPFDAATARRLLDRLALRGLLDGARGMPPVDVQAYCRAAARFSALALAFFDVIREIDLNPVMVLREGCVAVDALVVTADDSGAAPLAQTAAGT